MASFDRSLGFDYDKYVELKDEYRGPRVNKRLTDASSKRIVPGKTYRFSNGGIIRVKKADDTVVVGDLIREMPMDLMPMDLAPEDSAVMYLEQPNREIVVEIDMPTDVARELFLGDECGCGCDEPYQNSVSLRRAYVAVGENDEMIDQLDVNISTTDDDVVNFIQSYDNVALVTYDDNDSIIDSVVIK